MAEAAAAYPLLTSALIGGGTAIATAALTPKPSAPSAPSVSAPVALPNPNDSAVQQAQQTSIADQMARRGRASTILTQPDGTKLGD